MTSTVRFQDIALLAGLALAAVATGCGDDDSSCYSPSQNLDRAYESGASGCACSEDDEDVCIDGVALICDGDRWQAVEDGPCYPTSPGDGDGDGDGDQDGGAPDGGDDECPNGLIVDSRAGCYQDDAFCIELGDGRFCTGSAPPECPAGTTPIAKDAQCPDESFCFDYSESLRCQRPAAGPACGARAGDTCAEDEYCAYVAGELCGAGDAEATCMTRPDACDANFDPVCGCDGEDYGNACEAAAAGTGVLSMGPCE